MSGMRMLALGVGNAFSALYYSSCMAVEANGAWLLIDCPHPIRKIVREASRQAGVELGVEQFSGVVLTHLHADHCSGLETLGFFARFVIGRPVRLLAHPDVAARLWTGHLSGGMEWSVQAPGQAPLQRRLEEFFEVLPLDEAQAVSLGPFAVQCRRTQHSVPTTALLIRAGGRCLGYSADTAFDLALVSWLSAADLIVHEAGPGHQHTPYEMLAGLSPDLRERMRLIHYPDDFNVAASVIKPMRQGDFITV